MAQREVFGGEAIERGAPLIALAQAAAQRGVDESGGVAHIAHAGKRYGFMDGGVIGHAVQPENLVEAQPQQIAHERGLFAAGGALINQPIQRRAPTQDAVK